MSASHPPALASSPDAITASEIREITELAFRSQPIKTAAEIAAARTPPESLHYFGPPLPPPVAPPAYTAAALPSLILGADGRVLSETGDLLGHCTAGELLVLKPRIGASAAAFLEALRTGQSAESSTMDPSLYYHTLAVLALSSYVKGAVEEQGFGIRMDYWCPDKKIIFDITGANTQLKLQSVVLETQAHANSIRRVVAINKYALLKDLGAAPLVSLSVAAGQADFDYVRRKCEAQAEALSKSSNASVPLPSFQPDIAKFLSDPAAHAIAHELAVAELKDRVKKELEAAKTATTKPKWGAREIISAAAAVPSFAYNSPYFSRGSELSGGVETSECLGSVEALGFDGLREFHATVREMKLLAQKQVKPSATARALASLTEHEAYEPIPGGKIRVPVLNLEEKARSPWDFVSATDRILRLKNDPSAQRYYLSGISGKYVKRPDGSVAPVVNYDYLDDQEEVGWAPSRGEDVGPVQAAGTLDPAHVPLLKHSCDLLRSSRDYQEGRLKRRLAKVALRLRPGQTAHVPLPGGFWGELQSCGLASVTDKGITRVSIFHADGLRAHYSWRAADLCVAIGATSLMASVVEGAMADGLKKPEVALLYCRIIAEGSWATSVLLKPWRYAATGKCFDSPFLEDQWKKFEEELLCPDAAARGIVAVRSKHAKLSTRMLLDCLASSNASADGCLLTELGKDKVGYDAFLMNLAQSETYGHARHLAHAAKELAGEIRLYESVAAGAQADLTEDFRAAFMINPSKKSVREHFDKVYALGGRTGGRFTFSPLAALLIGPKFRALLDASDKTAVSAGPSLEELMTSKASFDSERVAACSAAESLLSLQSTLGTPTLVEMVCALVEGGPVDLTMRTFDKSQLGGDREISIMSAQMRALQVVVERTSRNLGSNTGVDMLANKNKVGLLSGAFSEATASLLRVFLTADQSRWAANFNTTMFAYMYATGARGNTGMFLPMLILAMAEFKVFEMPNLPGVESEATHRYTLPGALGRSHMGQGIFHYTSSLFHSLTLMLLADLTAELASEEAKVVVRPFCTSDDVCVTAHVLVANSAAPTPEEKEAHARIKLMWSVLGSCYWPVFCIKTSDYKNSVSETDLEFNSIFLGPGGVGSNSLKFLKSLLTFKTTGSASRDFAGAYSTYGSALSSGLTPDQAHLMASLHLVNLAHVWSLPLSAVPALSHAQLLAGLRSAVVLDPAGTICDEPALRAKTYQQLQEMITRLRAGARLEPYQEVALSRVSRSLNSASMRHGPVSCLYMSGRILRDYAPTAPGGRISIPAILSSIARSSSLHDLATPGAVTLAEHPVEKARHHKAGFSVRYLRSSDSDSLTSSGILTSLYPPPQFIGPGTTPADVVLHLMRSKSQGVKVLPREITKAAEALCEGDRPKTVVELASVQGMIEDYKRDYEAYSGSVQTLVFSPTEGTHTVLYKPHVAFPADVEPSIEVRVPESWNTMSEPSNIYLTRFARKARPGRRASSLIASGKAKLATKRAAMSLTSALADATLEEVHASEKAYCMHMSFDTAAMVDELEDMSKSEVAGLMAEINLIMANKPSSSFSFSLADVTLTEDDTKPAALDGFDGLTDLLEGRSRCVHFEVSGSFLAAEPEYFRAYCERSILRSAVAGNLAVVTVPEGFRPAAARSKLSCGSMYIDEARVVSPDSQVLSAFDPHEAAHAAQLAITRTASTLGSLADFFHESTPSSAAGYVPKSAVVREPVIPHRRLAGADSPPGGGRMPSWRIGVGYRGVTIVRQPPSNSTLVSWAEGMESLLACVPEQTSLPWLQSVVKTRLAKLVDEERGR